jgi:hypothetical protein
VQPFVRLRRWGYNIKMDLTEKEIVRVGTSSRSYPTAGFGIGGTENTAREFLSY